MSSVPSSGTIIQEYFVQSTFLFWTMEKVSYTHDGQIWPQKPLTFKKGNHFERQSLENISIQVKRIEMRENGIDCSKKLKK